MGWAYEYVYVLAELTVRVRFDGFLEGGAGVEGLRHGGRFSI
jgi:hypothetical protein